jgi:hypothetical protein
MDKRLAAATKYGNQAQKMQDNDGAAAAWFL